MNRTETATLLGLAAARDRRTVGEIDVLAWHTDLGDLTFADAKAALERHYRESTEYLMPAHIRAHAKDIRVERDRGKSEPLALGMASPFEPDTARDIRMERGMAQCKPVLDAIAAQLAAQRQPETEMSESDLRLQRARQRAAAEKRASRVRGVA